jgi:hypothetical protein
MQEVKENRLLATVRDEFSEAVRLYFQPLRAVTNSLSSTLKKKPMPQDGTPGSERRKRHSSRPLKRH